MDVRDNIENGDYDVKFSYNNREDRQKWRAEQKRLELRFRADIELEYGTTAHPKADKLYAMAWELGHSSGLLEVKNRYDDLVELVR